MTEKTLASPKPSEIPIANNFKKVFRQYGGILSGMVVLIILFSFINDSFFTANNITNIILQVSIIAITAYGMTYVLLLGDIDLSVGSTIALIVKWSTKTGHRVRVFSSIDFPIRLVVTHHYIRAVLVRCNIQRYSPLLRELHR